MRANRLGRSRARCLGAVALDAAVRRSDDARVSDKPTHEDTDVTQPATGAPEQSPGSATEAQQKRRAFVRERFAGPLLVLAPMEGVHDVAMRALMTELGGYRYAVTEFVRISQDVPPPRIFVAHAPELANGGRTPCGTPVDVQLLGSCLQRMPEAACSLVALGARAIDLNFGCPAKTVNRHDGGASLLKSAERIYQIVHAVRQAIPEDVALSAKLRLGWDDPADIDDNAAAAVAAGADWLTIHGRTRAAGYRPPALWPPIGRVAQQLGVPVVANGDLFTVADVLRCREETGLQHFMLGRGALADPTLAVRVAQALGIDAPATPYARTLTGWADWLGRYIALAESQAPRRASLPGRLKQWGMLSLRHGGSPWVQQIKRLPDAAQIIAAVRAFEAAHGDAAAAGAQTSHNVAPVSAS